MEEAKNQSPQLQKLQGRKKMRFPRKCLVNLIQNIPTMRWALLVFVFAQTPVCAEEVSISQLSGARIDSNWFRYINLRFGVAIDVPSQGYRYEVPVNGSGLALKSYSGGVNITIYAHFLVNILDDADNDVRRSISQLFDKAVSETIQKGGTVTYSVKKDEFYVISGNFGDDTYYERTTISPRCPGIFSSFRIFHPQTLERSLDELVTRMSKSLRATCQGAEGAARIN